MPQVIYYVRVMGFPLGVGSWFDNTTEGDDYAAVAAMAVDALRNPDVFVTHVAIGSFMRESGGHPTP